MAVGSTSLYTNIHSFKSVFWGPVYSKHCANYWCYDKKSPALLELIFQMGRWENNKCNWGKAGLWMGDADANKMHWQLRERSPSHAGKENRHFCWVLSVCGAVCFGWGSSLAKRNGNGRSSEIESRNTRKVDHWGGVSKDNWKERLRIMSQKAGQKVWALWFWDHWEFLSIRVI